MSRGPVACVKCRAPFTLCGKLLRCWLCKADVDTPVAIAALAGRVAYFLIPFGGAT